jgi:methyl-accepting chemotaxis protein
MTLISEYELPPRIAIMKASYRSWLSGIAAVMALMTLGSPSEAERADRAEKSTGATQSSAAAAPAANGDTAELSAQDLEVLAAAKEMARDITQIIEQWLASGAITEERLFSRLYYPIADTEPVKYNTDYDSLSDRDFPNVQEKYLSKSSMFLFAIASDSNGYVPTHNKQFSQPLSGNRALDFVNNRSKRFFGDTVGINGARSTAPYLRQIYQRDTGEVTENMSVPITIRGKHWGCVRIGYRRVEK